MYLEKNRYNNKSKCSRIFRLYLRETILVKLTKKGSRPSARSRVSDSSKASPLMLNSLSDLIYRIRTSPISPAFSTLECAC